MSPVNHEELTLRVKNITPDVLSVPALSRIVQAGEVVDVPAEQDGAVKTCRQCGAVEDGHPGADEGHAFEADDSHRLDWPVSMWEPVKDKPAPKTTPKNTEPQE